MMSIKLEKVWIAEFEGRQELRFDWSNDRHHSVRIQPPSGAYQIAMALRDAAWLIGRDPHLVPSNIGREQTPSDGT